MEESSSSTDADSPSVEDDEDLSVESLSSLHSLGVVVDVSLVVVEDSSSAAAAPSSSAFSLPMSWFIIIVAAV